MDHAVRPEVREQTYRVPHLAGQMSPKGETEPLGELRGRRDEYVHDKSGDNKGKYRHGRGASLRGEHGSGEYPQHRARRKDVECNPQKRRHVNAVSVNDGTSVTAMAPCPPLRQDLAPRHPTTAAFGKSKAHAHRFGKT